MSHCNGNIYERLYLLEQRLQALEQICINKLDNSILMDGNNRAISIPKRIRHLSKNTNEEIQNYLHLLQSNGIRGSDYNNLKQLGFTNNELSAFKKYQDLNNYDYGIDNIEDDPISYYADDEQDMVMNEKPSNEKHLNEKPSNEKHGNEKHGNENPFEKSIELAIAQTLPTQISTNEIQNGISTIGINSNGAKFKECDNERMEDLLNREKYLTTAREITKDVKVNPINFNSWLETGDTITINVQNQEAESIDKWDLHMASNAGQLGLKTNLGSGSQEIVRVNTRSLPQSDVQPIVQPIIQPIVQPNVKDVENEQNEKWHLELEATLSAICNCNSRGCKGACKHYYTQKECENRKTYLLICHTQPDVWVASICLNKNDAWQTIRFNFSDQPRRTCTFQEQKLIQHYKYLHVARK